MYLMLTCSRNFTMEKMCCKMAAKERVRSHVCQAVCIWVRSGSDSFQTSYELYQGSFGTAPRSPLQLSLLVRSDLSSIAVLTHGHNKGEFEWMNLWTIQGFIMPHQGFDGATLLCTKEEKTGLSWFSTPSSSWSQCSAPVQNLILKKKKKKEKKTKRKKKPIKLQWNTCSERDKEADLCGPSIFCFHGLGYITEDTIWRTSPRF